MVLKTTTIPSYAEVYINGKLVTDRPIVFFKPGTYEMEVYHTKKHRWIGGEKPAIIQNKRQGFGGVIEGHILDPSEKRGRFSCRRIEFEGF